MIVRGYGLLIVVLYHRDCSYHVNRGRMYRFATEAGGSTVWRGRSSPSQLSTADHACVPPLRTSMSRDTYFSLPLMCGSNCLWDVS
jgi:hypothetical protein